MKDNIKAGEQERRGLFRLGRFTGWLNRVRRFALYGYKYDSKAYIRRLNRDGAKIDESVVLYSPETVGLDSAMPFLLEIGKNVHIAAYADILTHDGAWMALKGADGVVEGHIAPVKIGSNVFIGRRSTILCGVTVCDNVVIGAGSVVSSPIKEPGVYAGNPAKLVFPLEQYREFRQGRQLREAYVIAEKYYERFREKPPQELFAEYFWLFAPRDTQTLHPKFRHRMTLGGSYEQAEAAFLAGKPEFDGYDAFWDWCLKKIQKNTGSTTEG